MKKTLLFLRRLALPLVIVATLTFIIERHFFSSEPSLPEHTNTTVSANPEVQTILHGKIMVAFRDSVTEFGNYPEIIAQNTGMAVQNMGFKGTRLAYHPYAAYEPFSLTNLIDAVISRDFSVQDLAIQEDRNYTPAFKQHYEDLKNIDFSQVDIVSVFIGTNDYMGNSADVVSLGTPDDTTRETFYGAINYFVNTMQTAFPAVDLVFVTPTWRMNHEELGGESASIQPNARDNYLSEFVDTLVERGEFYQIPTLDLYRTSGLSEENHTNFFIDEVHPNSNGYELIGNTISQFLIETYNKE
ncbi:Lysophospholipase L1 [Atopostipes suicloacalis DSM 15692]|uniref:Lysophospholipase L1 n=2 Tax=Atopostipes suicloacalis TaxID=180295 RepID=A0A1M4Z8R7_9LACT|nr:Lysophospholipase L1 [Atopostipes suicloacalis DSM 15692]